MNSPQAAWPEGDAGAHLQAGIAASQANDAREALRHFELASQAAPAWALPHFLMGSEHAAAGDPGAAEASFAQAVLLDASLHVARYQWGLLQLTQGRAAAALVTWQPLLGLEGPQGELAFFVRGFAALTNDRFEEARAHFEAGLAVPAGNPAIAADVRQVLQRLEGVNLQPHSSAPRESVPLGAEMMLAAYDRYRVH